MLDKFDYRLVLVSLLLVIHHPLSLACSDHCVQQYTMEMNKVQTSKNQSQLTTQFCVSMSKQIECINKALPKCETSQKMIVQGMLSMYIQPDYKRTCPTNKGQETVPTNSTNHQNPATDSPFTGVTIPGYGLQSQQMVLCTEHAKKCHDEFKEDFTVNMKEYNISGVCQSLKKLTLCFIDILSNECGQLETNVQNMVYKMQQEYGGMCSDDAQANTQDMIECTNKTMTCYTRFKNDFSQASIDYNLIVMCGALDNYTSCMQEVAGMEECKQFGKSTLSGIQQIKDRNNAFCGDDGGKTAYNCVNSFQDCYYSFNSSYFPALHSSDLKLMCRSVQTYAKCVARINPKCSKQLGQALTTSNLWKHQFSERCHPDILKLSKCNAVGQCSKKLMTEIQTVDNSNNVCKALSEYFQCVEVGLDECKLPRSTTEIDFGDLGKLMKEYCSKISGNTKLNQCPNFQTCTTAVYVTFKPDLRTMYEGSTWCTFMQMGVGCAEHALHSSDCFLDGDKELTKNIEDIDDLRVFTCEKDIFDSEFLDDADNRVEVNYGSNKDSEGDGGLVAVLCSQLLLAVIIMHAYSLI